MPSETGPWVLFTILHSYILTPGYFHHLDSAFQHMVSNQGVKCVKLILKEQQSTSISCLSGLEDDQTCNLHMTNVILLEQTYLERDLNREETASIDC